ncbi:AbiH family protein [Lentilactobacillus parakefiri]|uniref:AbiH family protein n=1 Tax=Lentilactobacillus parakefiri TaxID=152332 RepID=UPI003B84A299
MISFNYTLPFLYNKDSSNFLQVYKNVHGHIDNRIFNKTEKGETSSIIFGIDSQGINSKSPEYKFTKTYRTLDTTYKTVKDLLNHNISEIIFYGHSLNKSDFSYFMAVFDNFDIYNNTKLSLTFAYNSTVPHDKIDKFNQVSNLMFEYGRTLNNNHGNNLLHKLIIEGRISLKDIHL